MKECFEKLFMKPTIKG